MKELTAALLIYLFCFQLVFPVYAQDLNALPPASDIQPTQTLESSENDLPEEKQRMEPQTTVFPEKTTTVDFLAEGSLKLVREDLQEEGAAHNEIKNLPMLPLRTGQAEGPKAVENTQLVDYRIEAEEERRENGVEILGLLQEAERYVVRIRAWERVRGIAESNTQNSYLPGLQEEINSVQRDIEAKVSENSLEQTLEHQQTILARLRDLNNRSEMHLMNLREPRRIPLNDIADFEAQVYEVVLARLEAFWSNVIVPIIGNSNEFQEWQTLYDNIRARLTDHLDQLAPYETLPSITDADLFPQSRGWDEEDLVV